MSAGQEIKPAQTAKTARSARLSIFSQKGSKLLRVETYQEKKQHSFCLHCGILLKNFKSVQILQLKYVVDEILKKKAIYGWIIFAKFPETGKNCTKVIKTSANFKFEIHNLLRLNID